FFFSSRRRHTRSYGDWSSDVCSSDLVRQDHPALGVGVDDLDQRALVRLEDVAGLVRRAAGQVLGGREDPDDVHRQLDVRCKLERSEERRVGKEWRARETLWQ